MFTNLRAEYIANRDRLLANYQANRASLIALARPGILDNHPQVMPQFKYALWKLNHSFEWNTTILFVAFVEKVRVSRMLRRAQAKVRKANARTAKYSRTVGYDWNSWEKEERRRHYNDVAAQRIEAHFKQFADYYEY